METKRRPSITAIASAALGVIGMVAVWRGTGWIVFLGVVAIFAHFARAVLNDSREGGFASALASNGFLLFVIAGLLVSMKASPGSWIELVGIVLVGGAGLVFGAWQVSRPKSGLQRR